MELAKHAELTKEIGIPAILAILSAHGKEVLTEIPTA
ncbi:hypothetical protein BQ6471_00958 [Vibrio gazogenes]|nr:hypothetical protein BQ6471_00958 [Vibrio gazogenes]